MNFSPIEKYLDAVQAALAQVSSEQALTRRHRESSWANSRAFAEKAILNRKGEMYPTLQHAHIAMHISRKHDVLLRDEARRLATNRDASNYNRGDPNPPQGFPTLEQLLKVCYSELTPSRQKDLENQRAVLTFGSSTKPPPKVTPPDASTPPNKRRDRSRRGSSGRYAARVKAAALDCNISEDAAKAYLENFNVAGLELAKSTPSGATYATNRATWPGSARRRLTASPSRRQPTASDALTPSSRCWKLTGTILSTSAPIDPRAVSR